MRVWVSKQEDSIEKLKLYDEVRIGFAEAFIEVVEMETIVGDITVEEHSFTVITSATYQL